MTLTNLQKLWIIVAVMVLVFLAGMDAGGLGL